MTGVLSTETDSLYCRLVDLAEKVINARGWNEKKQLARELRTVADALRDQKIATTSEGAIDLACAYYLAGHPLHAAYYALGAQNNVSAADVVTHCAALLIAHDLKGMQLVAAKIATEPGYSDEEIASSLSSGKLSQQLVPNEDVECAIAKHVITGTLARAIRHIVTFIEQGDETGWGRAMQDLQHCAALAAGVWRADWYWRLVSLRMIAQTLKANSLWTTLQPMQQEDKQHRFVSPYIRNLVKEGVITLWEAQQDALPAVNGKNRPSLCLSVPTGAGKTRVAELMILRFLLDHASGDDADARCVYLAPLRALASEVEASLSRSFDGILGAEVSRLYGGSEVDPMDAWLVGRARILVMTPEKLDGLLRSNRSLLKRLRLVIVDEGHMAADQPGNLRERRIRHLLDRLIYHLKLRKAHRTGRMLFVSGVLPNPEDFARWIGGDDQAIIVRSKWRPTDEPQVVCYVWDGKEVQRCPDNGRCRDVVLPYKPLNTREDVAVALAIQEALNNGKPTLLFSASKQKIDGGKVSLVESVIKWWTGDRDKPLSVSPRGFARYKELLECGIAVEHGDLPKSLRELILERIRLGNAHLVIASPSLAQGVNLPLDVVVAYDLYHDNRPTSRMQHTTFWNVVGRVGRPIRSSRLEVKAPEVMVLVDTRKKRDKQAFRALVRDRDSYRAYSSWLLLLQEAARSLRIFSEKLSLTDAVQRFANGEASFIQRRNNKTGEESLQEQIRNLLSVLDGHLAALWQESADLGVTLDILEEDTKAVIEILAGATELDGEALQFLFELVKQRAVFIKGQDPARMRRAYLLGLTPAECDQVFQHQDTLLEHLRGCEAIVVGCENTLEDGIEHLLELIEFAYTLKSVRGKAVKAICYDQLGKRKRKVFEGMVRDWLRGRESWCPQETLERAFGKRTCNKYALDSSSVEEWFVERLPWALSALVRYLFDLAEEQGRPVSRRLAYLPAVLKYGVPNPEAVALRLLRLSRPGATSIGYRIIASPQYSPVTDNPNQLVDQVKRILPTIQTMPDELSPADAETLTRLVM